MRPPSRDATVEVNPYQTPEVSPDAHFVSPASQERGVFAALLEGGRLFARHWNLYLLVMVIVQTPLCLWGSYYDYFVFAPDDIRGTFRLSQFQEFFFGVIAIIAVIHIANLGVNRQVPTLFDGIGSGIRLWLRLIWIGFLGRLILILGLLLFVIPGIYLAVAISLAAVVAVVENQSGTAALNRSRELARGHFWFLAGVNVMSVILILMFTMAVHLPPVVLSLEIPWWCDAILGVIASFALPYTHLCCFAAYRQLVNPLGSVETASRE